MQDKMKISIALATFNGERYLPEQLNSFLNQTLLPDEVVISDDCSTDKTFEIIKNFAKTAPFIVKYWRNDKNIGYGANFSKAMMETQGDFVFLSDQDDVWYFNKIETMIMNYYNYPSYYVYMCDVNITDENLISTGLTKLGQLKSAGFSDKSYVMGAVCMIKKEFLDKCLPVPEKMMAHDSWVVNIASALEKKHITNQVLQDYRRHLENSSHAIINSTIKITRIRALMIQIKEYRRNRKSESFGDAISNLEVEITSLERIIRKFNGIEYQKLQEYIKRKYGHLYLTRERIKIRDYSFIFRLNAVLRMWTKGRYRDISGLRSAFRDILG